MPNGLHSYPFLLDFCPEAVIWLTGVMVLLVLELRMGGDGGVTHGWPDTFFPPFHTGHRPFQCHYCPYSASQKGNLKTHVLCVHRMPFDNSQYPDRRFKRSRVDSEASGNFEEAAPVKAGGFADLTDERGKGQEEGNWAEPVHRNSPRYSFKSCSWSHQFANCIPRGGGNHVRPLSSV